MVCWPLRLTYCLFMLAIYVWSAYTSDLRLACLRLKITYLCLLPNAVSQFYCMESKFLLWHLCREPDVMLTANVHQIFYAQMQPQIHFNLGLRIFPKPMRKLPGPPSPCWCISGFSWGRARCRACSRPATGQPVPWSRSLQTWCLPKTIKHQFE